MTRFFRFIAVGYVLALAVELQYKLIAKVNIHGLVAAVILYPILISMSYVASRLVDCFIRRRVAGDVLHYLGNHAVVTE